MSFLAKLAAFKSSTRFLFDYVHSLIAYSLITTAVWKWHWNLWACSIVFYCSILCIEWAYDTKYEHATWQDNLRDCVDYLAGVLLAIAVVKW